MEVSNGYGKILYFISRNIVTSKIQHFSDDDDDDDEPEHSSLTQNSFQNNSSLNLTTSKFHITMLVI